jgi:hypothetical protein
MTSTQADVKYADRIYKHQPLDVEKHQIRLLKLRNSSERTMDYCLTTFDYESAPRYVALSYTWGEKRPTGSVSIDGKKFEIGLNLLSFLSTYGEDEYLWIDQICIDQSNTQERSHQVQRMWKIYSRCDFVLVWLRDEPTHTSSTKQAALDFNNEVQSRIKHGRCEDGSRDEKECLGYPTLALLRNPYFDRLWIVQELLLSKNICILVEGNVWVSWKSLHAKHEELRHEIRELLPSTSWMVDAQYFRFVFAGHTPVSVTYYITLNVLKFCDKKCENLRDKVYGLMALVNPSSKIEIDYAKSIQRVYLDATMWMIREYLYMRCGVYGNGYQILKVPWDFELSVKASRSLAQAMGFTDHEMSGLRSFVECMWERVRRYEVTVKLLNLEMDTETHCITSVGFESETHQMARNKRLAPACSRWWYEFEGKRYYHDCQDWSGVSKLQEYTMSRKGLRLYGP